MWVVSSCVPQLPLQIEDAARRITDEDEGVFARVNQVRMHPIKAVFGIQIRRIRMFWGLPDPDPNPLVRGMDPNPASHPSFIP